MAKLIYIFGLLLLGFAFANAQKIYIQRSDVDSARSSFVTATYPFTIDIFISDLQNTNGIAFELDYSLANFIKFSQWKVGDYSPPQVVSFEDTLGNGRLIIGVGFGDNVQPDSNTTPKIISLEFVTLQNAQHQLTNTFKFNKPVATVIDSAGRSIVFLDSDTITFSIHGFIEVWPGDTDNNGFVDHLDFAPITQFIGLGSATKNMKSFKRKSGSSIWGPQRVLTWDSAAVTYADCDGNGDVTMSDMLVVTYNLSREKKSSINKNPDVIQSKLPKPNYYDIIDSKRISLNLNSNNNLLAITGVIDISNFDEKIYGVEPGNIFTDYPYNYSVINDNKLHFALGSYTREPSLDNGIIGNVVVSEDFNYNVYDYIIEMKGIDKNGNIIDLKTLSGVNDNLNNKYTYNQKQINFNIFADKILVYDILGNCIHNYSNNNTINTESWQNGMYIIQYVKNNNVEVFKYIKSN